MKRFYFFIFAILISVISLKAQSPTIENGLKEKIYTSDWTLLQQTSQVDVYYQYTVCEGTKDCCEFVFLKFQNKSNSKLTVKGDISLSRVPSGRIDNFPVSLSLLAGQSTQSDCNTNDNRIPLILVRERSTPDRMLIDKFDLKNLCSTIN